MKNIEQLAEAFQQLQKINKEIFRINDVAMQAAEDEMVIDIKLNLLNKTRVDQESNKYKEDIADIWENFLNTHSMRKLVWTSQGPQFISTCDTDSHKKNNISEFIFSCKESTAMKLLGILLEQKNEERKILIEHIKKLSADARL